MWLRIAVLLLIAGMIGGCSSRSGNQVSSPPAAPERPPAVPSNASTTNREPSPLSKPASEEPAVVDTKPSSSPPAPGSAESIFLRPNFAATDLPKIAVVGSVVDEKGRPVARLPLQLTAVGADRKPTTLRATSDKAGWFVFPVVTPGTPPLVRPADGVADWAVPAAHMVPDLKFDKGRVVANVRLVRVHRRIRGVVTDIDGNPARGVMIAAYRQPGVDATRFAGVAASADGRFELDVSKRGRAGDFVWLSASAAGRPTVWKMATLTKPVHDLQMMRRTTVSGAVRGPSGKPYAGADVVVQVGGPLPESTSNETPRSIVRVRTDSEGRYTIPNAAVGKASVLARVMDANIASVEIAVELTPEPATIDLQLRTAASVDGEVTDAKTGDPVSGAMVWVLPDFRQPNTSPRYIMLRLPQTRTDKSGSFKMLGPPCPAVVMVFAPGYQSHQAQVDVSSGKATVAVKLVPVSEKARRR